MENFNTTLGESCDFFNGKAHEKDIVDNGEFVVVNSKFISSDGLIRKYSSEQMFPLFKGDITMVMSDVPNGKALAKCFKIDQNKKYSLNQRICAIRTDKFFVDFLFYQLNRNSYFLEFDNGENQTNLRKGDILNCPLWRPSLETQKQIVQILDQAFAKIDQAIANIEQNIQNAEDLFQSKLNQIFSQKGEGWEEKKLGEVCYVLNGYAFKSKEAIEKSSTQLLRMGNLYQNVLDLNRKPVFYPDSFGIDYKEYILKEGDLIMSLTGTVDKTDYGYTVKVPSTEVNLLLNQRIMKIEVNDFNVLNKDYLRNYLLSPGFLKRLYATASGTRQANLSSRKILELKIFFPSLIQEQLEIVENLKNIRNHSRLLQQHYSKKLQNLQELKKSLLEKI